MIGQQSHANLRAVLQKHPRWRMVRTNAGPRLPGTRRFMIKIPKSPPCYLTASLSEEILALHPSPQMLPLKALPWKPSGSSDLLSMSYLFMLSACLSLVAQLCPTLCDPMDHSLLLCPWGILQSRIWASQPRDWTQVSCVAGGFFTAWATREALQMTPCK